MCRSFKCLLKLLEGLRFVRTEPTFGTIYTTDPLVQNTASIVSLRSTRIKGRGWGRRKRFRGKNGGVVGFSSSNSLPLSPSSLLYTPATQAKYRLPRWLAFDKPLSTICVQNYVRLWSGVGDPQFLFCISDLNYLIKQPIIWLHRLENYHANVLKRWQRRNWRWRLT